MPVFSSAVQIQLVLDGKVYDNFFCNTSLTVQQFLENTCQTFGIPTAGACTINNNPDINVSNTLAYYNVNTGARIEINTASVGMGVIPPQADALPSAPAYPTIPTMAPSQDFVYPLQQGMPAFPQQPANMSTPYTYPPYSYPQMPYQGYPPTAMPYSAPYQAQNYAPLPKPTTSLLKAAEEGDIQTVRAHIQHQTGELNKQNADGKTPLYLAAYNGHLGVVQELVQAGANIQLATAKGFYPLYVAAEKNHYQIVEYLIRMGANVNQKTASGFVPLYIAAENGLLPMCQLLVQSGAMVNSQNNDGFYPLYMACQNGHLSTVKYLHSMGANLNLPSNAGYIPLHVAAEYGQYDVLEYLLRNGGQVNKKSNNGYAPIYFAKKDHIKQLLKQYGA